MVSFDGSNGYEPIGVLLQGSDGSFYGTTESYYHTDPNDWETVFRLTVPGADSPKIVATSRSGSTVTLTWLALRSRFYQLQFTTNLAQPNWTNAGSPITATNTTASASETIGADRQRFYRVVLLP